MAIELAKAYVQIVPTTDGIEGSLTSAMSGAGEKAGQAGGKAVASGFGKVAGGIGKAATAGIVAAGTAAATAATGIIKGSSELAEFGDNIDKMSQKVGLSAEAYQEWDYILKISGTEMQNMTTGLKTLTNKLDDAKNGSEDAQAMFAALGLSMDDLSTMSREDLFAATITGFQGMADSTKRAALANDLFGKSGQELAPLFNTSAADTAALRDQVHQLGGVLSNDAVANSAAFQDNLTALQTGLAGMKNSILQQALPGLNQLMQGFTSLITGQEGASEAIGQGFQTLLANIGDIAQKVAGIVSELFPTLMQVIVDNLPSIIETGIGIIMDLATAIIEALPTIVQGICDMLPTVIPQIITAIVDLFLLIVDHLDEILTPIVEAMPDIINSLTDALIENLPRIIAGIIKLIAQIIIQLPGILKGIWETITHFFGKVWQEWIGPAAQVVVGWFRQLWENIKGAFAAVGQWFAQIFQGAWNGIKSAFSAVGSFFSGIWSKIKGAFSTVGSWFADIFSRAWEGIKRPFQAAGEWFSGVFERIKDVIKAPINFVIRGLNALIAGLNKVSFSIPNWVPIIGGKTFGFNIGYINELAQGGVLEKGQTGFLEGTGAEAVVPLEKNTGWIRRVAEEMRSAGPEAYETDTEDLVDAMRHMRIWLDGKIVAGGITTQMDQNLGNNQVMAGRMVARA